MIKENWIYKVLSSSKGKLSENLTRSRRCEEELYFNMPLSFWEGKIQRGYQVRKPALYIGLRRLRTMALCKEKQLCLLFFMNLQVIVPTGSFFVLLQSEEKKNE